MAHLADNVMHFARVLRDAGVPVGTDRVQLALQALGAGPLQTRRDFKAALAACFLSRAEHRALFDQAFELFWRDPDLLGRMLAMLLPRVKARDSGVTSPVQENRRLADALFPPNAAPPAAEPPATQTEIQASFSASEREVLRHRDFETMTAAEWREAQRLVARLATFIQPLPTRRQARANRPGRVDWRASLAAMARRGGDAADLVRWRRPRKQPPPLVVLADISGSMSRYSRMLLHFAHALSQQGQLRVESFVFGTRLTPITRSLRQRDPDAALATVARQVQDWSGGTRIGESLHAFNRQWARRVLGGGRATVLLVTDGLERGEVAQLGFEAERLGKSCRRLVWLNPLLRYAGFEPRAAGIRALRPHVDLFLPAHNLASLEHLAALLSTSSAARIPPWN
jgi:uncharacterized protein